MAETEVPEPEEREAIAGQGLPTSDGRVLHYGTGPVFDEMVTGGGRLRPHWQKFMGALGALDPSLMHERYWYALVIHQSKIQIYC